MADGPAGGHSARDEYREPELKVQWQDLNIPKLLITRQSDIRPVRVADRTRRRVERFSRPVIREIVRVSKPPGWVTDNNNNNDRDSVRVQGWMGWIRGERRCVSDVVERQGVESFRDVARPS